MGYGLPYFIGAIIDCKMKNKILIETDGSLMFNLQELATLYSLNKKVKVFILNNKGYASIRSTQKNYFNSRYLGTGSEDNFFFPDLKLIAKTFKFSYYKISNSINLKNKINRALSIKDNIIVDVRLNKNETLKPKVTSVFKNNKILTMPIEDMSPIISMKKLKEIMKNKIDKRSNLIRNK